MPEPREMPRPPVRVSIDGQVYDVKVEVRITPAPAKPPGRLIRMPDPDAKPDEPP